MPTVSNLVDRWKVKVLRKETFADDYEEDTSFRVDQSYAITCCSAPEIDSCVLRRPIGYLKEHDETELPDTVRTFGYYNGQHFKIRISVDDGATWETLFVGFCEETTYHIERADFNQGWQRCHLLGYAALLDKRPIRTGRVYNPCTETTHDLEWLPSFNGKNSKRRIDINLSGNRSSAPSDGIYVFSHEDGALWSNLDMAEYVIKLALPTTEFFPSLALTGQHISLNSIKKFWRSPEKPESMWKWLNKAVDRRYGFGFFLKYTDGAGEDDAGTLTADVFTTTDEDITVGPFTIPANANQTAFSLDFSYPENHEWEDIEFRRSNSERYHRIEVRGQRMLMVGSFRADVKGSWGKPMMVKQWTDSLQDNYRLGNGVSDARANDLARANDIFEPVFSHIAPPPEWPYKYFFDHGDERFFGLSSDDEGNVSNEDAAAPWYAGFHVFERTIPLHAGTDYSTSPPDVFTTMDPPEFRPMLGVAAFQYGGPRYGVLDRLHEIDPEYQSVQFRPLDNIPMGIGMHASPRHYLADPADEWSNAKPSDYQPTGRFLWDWIYFTAAWRLDTRQRIAESLFEEEEGEPDPNRTLTIDVEDAEYWYCMPGTIIDLKPTSQAKLIHPDNVVLRNDIEKLQGVMAAAKAWYGKDRQAVEFKLKTPKKHVEIGTMITAITGANFGSEAVRAVVTKRSITLRKDGADVKIETGWNNFDFAGAWSE